MTDRITRSEFEAALTPEAMRPLVLVVVMMLGAVCLAMFALLFMFYANAPDLVTAEAPDTSASDVLLVMTGMLGITTLVAWFIHGPIYRRMLQATDTDQGRVMSVGDGASLVQRVIRAEIVRTSIFEGVAFFGVGICFVAAAWGVLQQAPVFWVNIVPAVAFVAWAVLNLPSRERMVMIYRTHFEGL